MAEADNMIHTEEIGCVQNRNMAAGGENSSITVEEEFRKNPELKKQDLDELRDWMKSQAHLPKISDEQLILFLHSCYFKVEPTKKTIEVCYTIRTQTPELFGNMDPLSDDVQHAWKLVQITKLPEPDPEGRALVFGRLRDTDPHHFNFCNMLKLNHILTWSMLRDGGTNAGYVFIYDIAGFTLTHLSRIPLSTLKKHLTYVQEGYPLRMKGVHIINVPTYVDKIMTVIKPFLKKDIMKMVRFHTGRTDTLYTYVPRELLPKDYGGDQKSVEELCQAMKERVEACREWYLQEQTLKATGGKRRSSLVPDFRRLNID
ncbi:alpha-tocopherol transfer protein-like [Anabrus simplex]|uniref:alpha-tocopherol transfer protein-like n=1 Tax=Anabrus simplex TaxID=316456 RepID=UPI0035A3C0AD